MDAKTIVAEKLRALNPTRMEIRDDSDDHIGHREASAGAHLRVTIVSPVFEGMPALARHRLIQKTVGDYKAAKLHALQITAQTPAESPVIPAQAGIQP